MFSKIFMFFLGNSQKFIYLFGGKIIPINQILKMNSQYSGILYLIVNRSPHVRL